MRVYEKPVITVDSGMAEGIYAASGATQGTLNVTYHGDRRCIGTVRMEWKHRYFNFCKYCIKSTYNWNSYRSWNQH